jgi:hypothetical protein
MRFRIGNRVTGRILAIALAMGMAGAAAPAHAQLAPLEDGSFAPQCDRACLRDVMDLYLDALTSNDPSRLPVGIKVKFTENGVELPLGEAGWRTMDGLRGRFRQYTIDPEGGNVGFHGVVEENGENAILSVRLHMRDGLIREIEQIVVRNDEAARRLLDRGEPDAIWSESVPAGERLTREQMVAVANAYFSAIQRGAGTHVGFTEDCYRLENGLRMTGNPSLDRPGRPIPIHSMGCTEQLGLKGYLAFDTELRDRRFMVVDEEKGIVFAHVFFDHAGDVAETVLEDGTRVPVQLRVQRPYSLQVHEVFKLEAGRVARILAALNSVPFGMRSSWETRD